MIDPWPRTWLFVPGDRPDRFDKAVRSGAEAVIVDLEDAVVPGRRDEAARGAADWLSTGDRPVPVFVRVSGPSPSEADRIAMGPADGVVVPKVDEPEAFDLFPLGLPIVAMVETARGLAEADMLAAHPATIGLMIGEYDLAADLGVDASVGDHALEPARFAVVLAAAAAGIAPPIGPVDGDFRDPHRLEATTRDLLARGFGSRAIIHPDQVVPVHRALSPTAEELADAQRRIDAFEAALAAGSGVATDPDGRMMDEATIRAARRVLARHRP